MQLFQTDERDGLVHRHKGDVPKLLQELERERLASLQRKIKIVWDHCKDAHDSEIKEVFTTRYVLPYE